MDLPTLLVLDDDATGEIEIFLIPAGEPAGDAAMALTGEEYEFPPEPDEGEDGEEPDSNADLLMRAVCDPKKRELWHQGSFTDGPYQLPRWPCHVAWVRVVNAPEY